MRVRRLPMTHGLTAVNQQAASTFVGMAHFAGTGPVGGTCGQCSFWGDGNQPERFAKDRMKPRTCLKHRQLTGREGAAVPHYAGACRHFVPTKFSWDS
jgi:hypothetical protein